MINVRKIRRMAMLLALLMMMSTLLAACVNLDEIPEIDPNDILGDTSFGDAVATEDEIPTPEGATAAPVNVSVINVAPYTVAISGNCEKGATIRVEGGAEPVETIANGEYFIIQTDIIYADNLLRVTAQANGKDVSPEREVIASYNATADSLLNGNNVSVGVDSRLYFDRMVQDASGANLYTASQLEAIKNYVNNTTMTYYIDKAGSQPVELIYVLVPNTTTIYPEVLPEGVVGEHHTTIYDQVLNTLNGTLATVIDMRAVFQAELAGTTDLDTYGGLYRVTDSSLTDYGAYLTYAEIMKRISVNFPNAAARPLGEFAVENVTAKGGNLVKNRGLDVDMINEDIVRLKPEFSMDLGEDVTGSSKLTSLVKYEDEANKDFSYFEALDSADNLNGIGERWLIDTKRADAGLPNAIIYRDNSSLAFSDILAERFNKSLLVATNSYVIDLSQAGQYKADGKNVVDYIVVVVSEDSMDTAFSEALK